MIALLSCEFIHLRADEVGEGFLGGGLLGAAIGGAAGGGRGAAIGGAVGASVGAMTGAAVHERRKRRYEDYEYSERLYEQNDELRYENKELIRKHKKYVQLHERYQWMLNQCRKGKIGYRKLAKQYFFEDDTNYGKFRRWKNKESIRGQNKQLAKVNGRLRSKIRRLKEKTRHLKSNKLLRCEEE